MSNSWVWASSGVSFWCEEIEAVHKTLHIFALCENENISAHWIQLSFPLCRLRCQRRWWCRIGMSPPAARYHRTTIVSHSFRPLWFSCDVFRLTLTQPLLLFSCPGSSLPTPGHSLHWLSHCHLRILRETRTQVLELGPRDGSLLCSSLIWSNLIWSNLI